MGPRDEGVKSILWATRQIHSLKKDSVLSTEVFGGQVTVISQFATTFALKGALDIFESNSFILQGGKWDQGCPR